MERQVCEMNDRRYSSNNEEELTMNSNGPLSNEVMITPNHGRAPRSRRPRILTVIIVLLIVTCIILIVVYTLERGKRRRAEKRIQDESPTSSKNLVCTSPHCVLTASAILKNLDKRTDPCKDFYKFACGGWQKDHPIPDSDASWNQVEEIKLSNTKTMRRLLESKETRAKYSKNAVVLKVYDYYDLCTNTRAIESAGLSPLKTTMLKFGSWNITDDKYTGSWDFVDTLTSMHRELNIEPFFSVSVRPDIKNSSMYIIMIDQARHAITRQSYLTNSSYHKAVRHAYMNLMYDVARLLGARSNPESKLYEIFEFEKKLSEISLSEAERTDTTKLYKLMKIKELTSLSTNQINWKKILNGIFKNVHGSFTEDDQVVVLAADYIKNLAVLLSKTPERVIRNFMMWQLVIQLSPHVGSATQSAFYRFKSVVDGSFGAIPTWEKCVNQLSRSSVGNPLGLIFIDEKFQKESLEVVSNLINDQREAFIANLQNLDWMDETTKKKAIEKARAIRQNIGYPDYLRNPEELNKRYTELLINKTSYFTTLLNVLQFAVHRHLSLLNKPVNKNRWNIPPQTVNAYYDRVANKITFPAGFLQPPFFDPGFPRAVSYGGIGTVVAHEITHGFDSNGRKYNKMGDLFNWWTNSSNDAFVRKSQCFVDQYSNITDYDMQLNGVQTLGENIADNGAIKQAFMAYRNWVEKYQEEPTLPGMNYTNDQLFFISAAQIDCGSLRPQTAKKLIEIGAHTLSEWRVTLEMSNSREFSKAFRCPAGSRMNPRIKCEVW